MRFTHRLDRSLRALLIVLMAVMVLVVTWQVVTRFILGDPSSYTEELASYLLIWISLLGGAYALRLRAHLGVDVLTRNLTGRRRALVRYLTYGSVIVFAVVVFIYGGLRLVYVTLHLEQISAALRVPVGWVYSVIPLSGALMVYYAAVLLVEDHRRDPAADGGLGPLGGEGQA